MKDLHGMTDCEFFIFGGFVRDVVAKTSCSNDLDITYKGTKEHLESCCLKNKLLFKSHGDFIRIIRNVDDKHTFVEGMNSQHSIDCESPYELDFTINTLYYDLNDQAIADMTGRGIDDINNRILTIPCPEDKDHFDKWIDGDKTPYKFRKAFRFYDFVGRGFIPSDRLSTFVSIYVQEMMHCFPDLFVSRIKEYLCDGAINQRNGIKLMIEMVPNLLENLEKILNKDGSLVNDLNKQKRADRINSILILLRPITLVKQ